MCPGTNGGQSTGTAQRVFAAVKQERWKERRMDGWTEGEMEKKRREGRKKEGGKEGRKLVNHKQMTTKLKSRWYRTYMEHPRIRR